MGCRYTLGNDRTREEEVRWKGDKRLRKEMTRWKRKGNKEIEGKWKKKGTETKG